MRLTLLITQRLFRQLLRDHRTVGIVLILPVVFMIMFGVAFGGEIEHVPIIVINHDSEASVVINQTVAVGPFQVNITIFNDTVSAIGDTLVENLGDKDKRVDVSLFDDFEDAKTQVDNKKFACVLLIPENFTYNLVSPLGENVSIEIYLDNSNPQIGAVVLGAIQEAFQTATGEISGSLDLNIGFAFGEGISTLDFFAPGMIVYAIFFFSFLLVVMNLIEERKQGTLPLLLQCPSDKIEIILGYLLAFSVVSAIQTSLIILVAGVVFQVSFGTTIAHYLSIYLGSIIVGWTGLVLAIFLSSFARSEFQAVQFIPIVIIPILLLSGIILPLSQIPEIIRWVSYLLPTTYAVHLLRAIAIEGYVLEIFNFDLLYQLGFFVIVLLGSRLTLRET